MIPDCDLDARHLAPATPPAPARASRSATSPRGARSRRWSTQIHKVETAIEPRFQEHFVAANAIPHATAAFPHLAGVAPLPDVHFNAGADGRGRPPPPRLTRRAGGVSPVSERCALRGVDHAGVLAASLSRGTGIGGRPVSNGSTAREPSLDEVFDPVALARRIALARVEREQAIARREAARAEHASPAPPRPDAKAAMAWRRANSNR